MLDEFIKGQRIRCYDNGGKTLDRYTVVYLEQPERVGYKVFEARGMNSEPYHGIGMLCSATPGKHLGNRIKFDLLPPKCRQLVTADCEAYTRFGVSADATGQNGTANHG